ncbi:MAG: ATP-dependent DNA helicase [Ruminococcaceae bacterium]|nr:ATP-dependent DNA helicase [Oscillospiraceae bacterium]
MNIKLSDAGEIIISAREICVCPDIPFGTYPMFLPSASPTEEREMPSDVSCRMLFEGEAFIIETSNDGISKTKDGLVIEKTKQVKRAPMRIFSDSSFVAEGCISALALCRERKLSGVSLQLTYIDKNDNATGYRAYLSYPLLERIVKILLENSFFFAKVRKDFLQKGIDNIKNMPFPYKSIREGQRDFILKAFKAIKTGKRLVAVAPTGIGKTVSALYPAVKSLATGHTEKIFYLTAKTVTGKAAEETAAVINKFVPELRTVTIVAKERMCPSKDKKNPFKVDKCTFNCPRLCDSQDGSYSTRVKAALTELLSSGTVYGSDEIRAAAEKFALCPYELSLDLSEYCQIIICDYNYAFDTRIRFRRYFTENDLRYVFLIDEAHNLPDRAREMYCGNLDVSLIKNLVETATEVKYFNATLHEKANSLISNFEAVRALCLENTELAGAESYGYSVENEIPKELLRSIRELSRALSDAEKFCENEKLLPLIEKASSKLSDILHAADFFDEHFVFFGEAIGDTLRFRILCLDPSNILDTIMKGAVSTILFSATLTPTDYFADLFGCRKATLLELDSPYDSENLCLVAMDKVSTRYVTRGDTAKKIAEIIITTVLAKAGNYMIYFPSYEYMNTVVKEFLRAAPKHIKAVAQKSGMSVEARARFLSFFENATDGETLVGFCVLGGIFSEGIDLPDKMLIGAVLVGIGLPGISSELNILKDYYDRTREDGHGFAYLYPAMIKIQQAAGRVIRSGTDRGVVVLIDERYADRQIQKLFPSHWSHMKYVGDTYSLSGVLEKFWKL